MVLEPELERYWYVAEQDGDVWRFDNDRSSQEQSRVLRLSSRLETGFELGLLGIALHPDFQENGYLYAHFTERDSGMLKGRISRFTWNASLGQFDEDSELIVMDVDQPFDNHNGGTIAFGLDGYLYWALGDGGSAGDPLGHGQNTDTVLGTIVRIDVNSGTPYSIPADNPFAGGGGAPEIYAWGLRNPYSMHIDPITGDIWTGDVGQYDWEEMDRIELGGNYGWNIKEGTHCYAVTPCDDPVLIDPVIEYPNPSGGASVVGGPVYRGMSMPELQGTVFYSDFYTGQLWGITWDPVTAEAESTLFAVETGRYFSGFAQDSAGEVYVMSYYDGQLFEVTPGSGTPVSTIPTHLSETGCVDSADPTQPAEGLVPYGVSAQLWSDGAEKTRWMAVPDGEVVTVGPENQLQFPVGTVLVKNFSRDGQRLETRLMVHHDDDGWAGYSYAWSPDGSTATYNPGGSAIPTGDSHWQVPSSAQCMQCHTQASGQTLGLELGQMTEPLEYSPGRTADQLATLMHIGLLEDVSGVDFDVLPAVDDASASLEARARAVLHTNCASCHREGGTGGSDMDLRFNTPVSDMGACDVEPLSGTLGTVGARLLAPGESDRSMIAVRMGVRGLGQMPPLGSDEVDTAGLAVVRDWIDGMSGCP
ncbi:MAG: PQQ-dependent sugar dehydrogenase [Myxococcota bacterium]